jgi:hypothetical protein
VITEETGGILADDRLSPDFRNTMDTMRERRPQTDQDRMQARISPSTFGVSGKHGLPMDNHKPPYPTGDASI